MKEEPTTSRLDQQFLLVHGRPATITHFNIAENNGLIVYIIGMYALASFLDECSSLYFCNVRNRKRNEVTLTWLVFDELEDGRGEGIFSVNEEVLNGAMQGGRCSYDYAAVDN